MVFFRPSRQYWSIPFRYFTTIYSFISSSHQSDKDIFAGYEIFRETAIADVFFDIAPFSLYANRRFGGM
jgi:hypothetical protein